MNSKDFLNVVVPNISFKREYSLRHLHTNKKMVSGLVPIVRIKKGRTFKSSC